MDKKVTAIAGLALGAVLAAGYGLYKYFGKKSDKSTTNDSGHETSRNGLSNGFMGNSLIKSINLYGGHVDNGLVGGGLTLSPTWQTH
ncbi:hypothetical protein GO730_31955 [Spirosoma sp. HMF3257]|uniref:Uncharacterized protein n=1 Tax=Spirosoma telluris TaxID=2183553 RepID=A0A327NS97_9BACT|nr:hypothetical protein [Spirosoma telluris]RAI77605.1 hypothetical protein HMF3257_31850 [Spirosoma telluris]